MLDPGRQGALKVGAEHFKGLAWQAVHEVDADIADAGIAAGLYRLEGLGCGVTAAQELEQAVVEGLDTHAYAVYAYSLEGAYIAGSYVIGITLYRQFLKSVQAQG